MNLKFPNSDIDFTITPAYFLGDFNIYDREESLGEYLNKFNPNNSEELCLVLEEKFFNGGRVLELSLEHKLELLRVLANALAQKEYDFASVIDNQDDEYFYLPYSWAIKNPRNFFETIYSQMYKHWSKDFIKAGFDFSEEVEVL